MKINDHTEVWYELQWSVKGTDDWFTTASAADTRESAKSKLTEYKLNGSPDLDYRIIKKTLTEEPLIDNPAIQHIDGSPLNNHPSNLRVVTMKENCR